MKWQDASEIVGGYILKKVKDPSAKMGLDPNAVNPLDMWPGHAHIVTMAREGKTMPEIVEKDFAAVDACLHAVERVNGTMKNPLDYLLILKNTATLAKNAVDVKKIYEKMEKGEIVSPTELLAVAESMSRGGSQWIPMSEVEPQTVKFVPTGYPPLDKYTGGVPYACVTIIGGTPGLGKTTLGLRLIERMVKLKANEGKKAAILSLEMTMGQIHQRFVEMSKLTKEQKSRILLNRIFNIHALCAAVSELAAKEDLCAVMIDFADLLVEGEQSESAMGVIYKNLELLATKIEVPIILICQLNREMYKGGLPRIYHIRYSGLAEATARMVLLLFNPVSSMVAFDQEKIPLQVVPGRAYILVAKSNFGFKENGPGGIMVDFDGEKGWSDKEYGYHPIVG